MIDEAVKRVLYLVLERIEAADNGLIEARIEHPEHDRVLVQCQTVAACAIVSAKLEAMGFKIQFATLPGQRWFNVHLSMEKLRKAVYEIRAAIEMPGDDVEDVRNQLIETLNQLGARTLVLDVKVLVDRAKDARQS